MLLLLLLLHFLLLISRSFRGGRRLGRGARQLPAHLAFDDGHTGPPRIRTDARPHNVGELWAGDVQNAEKSKSRK